MKSALRCLLFVWLLCMAVLGQTVVLCFAFGWSSLAAFEVSIVMVLAGFFIDSLLDVS